MLQFNTSQNKLTFKTIETIELVKKQTMSQRKMEDFKVNNPKTKNLCP